MKKLVAILAVAVLVITFIVFKSPALHENKTGMVNITQQENEYEDDMEKAMAQEFEATKDPALGYVPRERLIRAQQQAEQITNIRSTLLQAQAISWAERGPNNVAGRVRALFIDKRDATGNTIFTAGVGGGIWKCTNFKTSPVWTVVNDFLANLAVCALAQDPNTPNTMYAGTGEGWFNVDNIRGNGMYKSTDGGVTWNALAFTDVAVRKDFENVNDIIVTSNGTVFAACRSSSFCNRGGILRSVDGGNSFTTVIGSFTTGGTCTDALNYRGADLEIAANGDLYATTGYSSSLSENTGRIWKSAAADNGALNTWTNITPIPASGTWSRIELACAPGDANNLLVLIAGNDNAIKSIQRSVDGGASWTIVNNPLWCDQGVSKIDFTRGQAWYDLSAAIDPNNINSFIIGGVDMLKTADNGSSFTQISQWASGCAGSFVHADIHNIIYYPGSSNQIIAATDGGIFYSSNGGTSFADRNVGFNITQFYALALHPASGSNYMLAGAQDNGTHRFQNTGINNTTKPLGGDGAFCFIDQDNPNIQIGSFTSTNYRVSRDGGNFFSFGTSNGTGRFINPADYDSDLNILFHATTAGSLGFIKNIDAGTLTPVQTVITELIGSQISAVKIDPNVPKRVWVAGSIGSAAPKLLRIDNDTALMPTVTICTAPLTNAGAFISSIDVEAGNSNHVLVTVSNYGLNSVFESSDGGGSWASIEGNLPDMPVRWGIFLPDGLTFSVGNGSGIALATEVGVWTTNLSNGSATTWVPNNGGMANVSTYMLKYRPSDRTLAAATHGRGLYTSILGVATGVTTIRNNKQFITLVYPTLATAEVKFNTGGATGIKQITVQVHDMQGRQLQQNTMAFKNGQLSLAALPTGIYFVKFTSDNRKYTHLQKIVKQ